MERDLAGRQPRGATSRLTVGLFAPYKGYGGTEEHLNKLVRPLSEMGYRLVFFHPWTEPYHWVEAVSRYAKPFCYAANGTGPQSAEGPGRNPLAGNSLFGLIRQLHRRAMPREVRFLAGFLREAVRLCSVFRAAPVDVLWAPDVGVQPFILAARLAGVPRVTGALGCIPSTDPRRSTSFFRALEALCLCLVDGIASVSEHGRDLWLKRTRLNPRRVRVIHNGIELAPIETKEETSQAVRQEFSIPPDAMVVGVSAALADHKGHRFLLEAFPAALQSLPAAWLMLAGEGPSRAELERQAKELGISERVIFLGHRADIDRVVEAYDVIALPSLSESMPFSLLEGMAAGKPVVASAVGGIPELIEDGRTGYLVPPSDSYAMAEALIKVLRDPAETVLMGQAARERVKKHFSLEKMVEDTVALMLGKCCD